MWFETAKSVFTLEGIEGNHFRGIDGERSRENLPTPYEVRSTYRDGVERKKTPHIVFRYPPSVAYQVAYYHH